MTVTREQKRCAVYTRKSSEEGLDQSFNSLHAQREACEAYVLSQKHEGWTLLTGEYDDGGFSGGNMERPGLRKLMADISAGSVDTVVVYKVDRLTRSLADFAKMVEAFDRNSVSFVSVTQQFNTTTSMGRLTLNVLLSFAQFEREVTGERIRDKVAASKRKGIWMGGQVPLGYDLGARELVVNEQEAEQVREIFRQYLRLGSVFALREYLRGTDIRSKRKVSAAGRVSGGLVLSRGTLYHLLSNPLYIGQVAHRKALYQGRHPAIVEPDLWDGVSELLQAQQVRRKHSRNLPSGRMLLGLLFSASGEAYQPTHASKQGRRYFYYICPTSSGKVLRVPAGEIEGVVRRRLIQFLEDPIELAGCFDGQSVSHKRLLVAAGKLQAERLSDPGEIGDRFLRKILRRTVAAESSIGIEVCRAELLACLLDKSIPATEREDGLAPLTLSASFTARKRGVETRLVLSAGKRAEPAPALMKAVARARDWAERIAAGEITSMAELMAYSGFARKYCRRVLKLATLCPQLADQIMRGQQPFELTVEKLIQTLAPEWTKQIESFKASSQ